MEDYTQALNLKPKHFKSLVNRGFSRDMMGQHGEATAWLNMAEGGERPAQRGYHLAQRGAAVRASPPYHSLGGQIRSAGGLLGLGDGTQAAGKGTLVHC